MDEGRMINEEIGQQPKETYRAEEFDNIMLTDLQFVRLLGAGSYGKVSLMQLVDDPSRTFAIKQLKKSGKLSKSKYFRREEEILSKVHCDFIIKLFKTFEKTHSIYLLMESCLGGDLESQLKLGGPFSENSTRFYIGCVVEALEYLHMRSIIHRDLKPANVLLDNCGYAKLADFGLSISTIEHGRSHSTCGTYAYFAPETLREEPQDNGLDCWSLGVLMYKLLCDKYPFPCKNLLDYTASVFIGIDIIQFPKSISIAGATMIKKLCRPNSKHRLGNQRIGVSQIKQEEYDDAVDMRIIVNVNLAFRWFAGFYFERLRQRTLEAPPILHKTPSVPETSNSSKCREGTALDGTE